MIFMNIIKFVIINELGKDHSMIETVLLKNNVIFIQIILSFVLSKKIINIYNDIARKYGKITNYIRIKYCLKIYSE